MSHQKDSTARASRAMATLRFTGTRTTHTWLRDLCQSKYVEIAATQKLEAASLLRTKHWRIQ